jgi:HTH-type transcriptional regulator / antitoxin HigA
MRTAFPIRNDEDLDRAIELVDELWNAAPGSADADLLEVMTTLVDRYEASTSELPSADPIELIQFKLREFGWSQRELGRKLGWSAGRVSEILSRVRPLTLAMVRSLSRVLELPAGLLVHDTSSADESVLWIAVPPPLASTISTAAERRGVSVQVAATEALGWAFRGPVGGIQVTNVASLGPANTDLRNIQIQTGAPADAADDVIVELTKSAA